MPVIHFGESDYLQSKTIEAGIYPSEVTKIEGPSKSASGKSVSYFFDITITEGKFKGKTRTIVFNSGTQSPSLMGEMQFFPTSYMLQLAQACNIDDGEVKQTSFDTDNLLHQPFDGAWGVATVDGRLINVINAFHNAGYAAAAPAF